MLARSPNPMPHGAARYVVVLAATMLAMACGDDGGVELPATGSVEIMASTTGPEPDADGYTVTLGTESLDIGVNETVTVSNVPTGAADAELTGVAFNCKVVGDNPTRLTVAGGETATVGYDVVCGEAIVGGVPEVAVGLAFVREGTVFVSRLDESAPVPLVPEATRPAWSPEGTRIAFTRPTNDRLDKWQLCVAWADGSHVRCATGERDGDIVGGPSWSPDGVNVAFSVFIHSCPNGHCGQHGGYSSGLLVLNTLSMKVDTVNSPALGSVSWSPDGRKIAFTTFGSGRGVLGIMNPDGSGRVIRAQSFDSYTVREVAWSPDGGRLALALDDESACPWHCDTAIGIVDADGTDLKVLTKARILEQSYVGTPTWSPDGSVVAYTFTRGDECMYGNYGCGSDIVVVRVDGAGTDVLLANGGFPSWRR